MKSPFIAVACLWAIAGVGRSQLSHPTRESAIRSVWQTYLESKHGRFAANAETPSALWVQSEQRRWRMYDLAGFYVPDNAVSNVMSIRPVSPRDTGLYEIITQFFAPGSTPASSTAMPFVTTTVYAIRENGQWLLSNALTHNTAKWEQHTVAQIHYFVEPGLRFDSVKARDAVEFIDSLAAVFGVPKLGPMEYYVTSSVDAAMNSLGADFPVKYGPNGAFSKPVNHQTFSGIPSLGEDYRHELTHMVLAPLFTGQTATILATEGVATWFGGSSGYDFPTVARELGQYLAENPDVTLDSIMASRSMPQWVTYTAGAILCAILSDTRGAPGVVEFMQAGPTPDDLRVALVRLLGKPWPAIVQEWRARVERSATD